MTRLEVTAAVRAVRKNMDEMRFNASDIYGPTDNDELDDIIRKTIPEAINAVNRAVPPALLQGITVRPEWSETRQGQTTWKSDFAYMDVHGHTLHFTIDDDCLRIVALRAIDSPVTVTGEVAEDSPEGRMQLNPYTRGTFDSPVLVRNQIHRTGMTSYSYFSLIDDMDGFDLETWLAEHGQEGRDTFPLEGVEYMPLCRLERGKLYHNDGAEHYYDISEQVVDMVIYQLTGMVLVICGETDKAKYFLSLAGLTPAS